ncbi:MAG: hypothetical protein A2X22_05860 [Bacteroidetes bacterium GWF2_49_14]|nr:MAG: hypothetical protein A2X22_05860 [Bacteroidetes bacterium GWF2_49_14]HBB92876.1 hypothetical protein [Bacteroidales bacterium]
MFRFFFALLACILLFLPAKTQGLFESGLNNTGKNNTSQMILSGYTRAAGYIGLNKETDPLLHSLYSETALRMKATSGARGQAFADIRFRTGAEFGKAFTEIDVREAYADLYLGKFDLRAGKQISSWGRADGFNPTDNLTPKNYFVRSSDPDDMRLGNFMLRGRLKPWSFLIIEADVVPWYIPSNYRFDLVDMPDFVTIESPTHPGYIWDKSTVAAKLDLILSAAEGSVSWFSGYDPMPVLRPGALPNPPFTDFSLSLYQVPFRQQTLGADFATIILKTGLRGEFAWKKPIVSEEPDPLLPAEEIQWVLSLDREFGPLRLIASYNGKFIPGFTPADPPAAFDPAMLADSSLWPYLGPMLTGQIGNYNRVLFDQTNEWSHTVMVRPSLTLLHETLELEVNALYNISTSEYLLYPKVTWHISDGVRAEIGYQYYEGGDYTRFNWIRKVFNGPFCEIRINF